MKTTSFTPNGAAHLIGSLPLRDHEEVQRLMFSFTPEVPLWIQLPIFPQEGMIPQFLPGFPALREEEGSFYIEINTPFAEQEMLSFYEEYLIVTSDMDRLESSRFAFAPQAAPGFFTFENALENRTLPQLPVAVKGQVTGPFTFATSVTDEAKRAVFYDIQLRDIAIKLIATKALWQTRRLARFGHPVLMYLDEPALAGFGSSEYISISKEDVLTCLTEVISMIHTGGGLAGIHVCANTDWALVLSSGADIVNFDAYSYLDRFLLYASDVGDFLTNGGMIAWGIVPTLDIEEILIETVDSLTNKVQTGMRILSEKTGISAGQIRSQSLITPSCGLGSQTLEGAHKVLGLVKGVSQALQAGGL